MFFRMKENNQCLLTQNLNQTLYRVDSKPLDLEYFLSQSFSEHLLNTNDESYWIKGMTYKHNGNLIISHQLKNLENWTKVISKVLKFSG